MEKLDVLSPEFIIDRELSWLDFNTRVLELAEDTSIPLLERVRFLAIFSSNLDDFFMIRVAATKLKIESGASAPNASGLTPVALLEEITQKVSELIKRFAFLQGMIPDPSKKPGAKTPEEEFAEFLLQKEVAAREAVQMGAQK